MVITTIRCISTESADIYLMKLFANTPSSRDTMVAALVSVIVLGGLWVRARMTDEIVFVVFRDRDVFGLENTDSGIKFTADFWRHLSPVSAILGFGFRSARRTSEPKLKLFSHGNDGFISNAVMGVRTDRTDAPNFVDTLYFQSNFDRGYFVSVPHCILMIGLFAMVRRICGIVWRKKATEGLCWFCGYDLRASPERCPECGIPICEENRHLIQSSQKILFWRAVLTMIVVLLAYNATSTVIETNRIYRHSSSLPNGLHLGTAGPARGDDLFLRKTVDPVSLVLVVLAIVATATFWAYAIILFLEMTVTYVVPFLVPWLTYSQQHRQQPRK